MRLLVKMEFQKVIRQKYLFAGALLLIIYMLLWFFACGINSDAAFPVHTADGYVLSGRQAILYNKDLYEQYSGDLTDKKVAEILNDFQTVKEEYESSHVDLYKAPKIYEDFSLFRTTEESNSERHISKYGYISIGSSDIPNFDTPLYFTFSSTWKVADDIFYNSSLGVALFLLISLAPIFAEEYNSGAAGIILSTRYGKNKIIVAKCIVALLVATMAALLFALTVLLLCGIYFGGFAGWQADIQTQFGSLLMPVPLRMNNLEFFIFSVLLNWLSAVGVAALVCFCSAFSKRTLSALAASGALYALPLLIRQFGIGGTVVGELMLLFPGCSSKAQQVLRTSEYKNIDLLPAVCEMPIWIALFTVVSISALFFLTYRHFSRYQVTD